MIDPEAASQNPFELVLSVQPDHPSKGVSLTTSPSFRLKARDWLVVATGQEFPSEGYVSAFQ
jgi:hypothetical protein